MLSAIIKSAVCPTVFQSADIYSALKKDGSIVLHMEGFDLTAFSQLIGQLCGRLTFDPAREHVSAAAQSVDAGTDAVGLHIENGNTPLPPDIVSFYSARSATEGAQTTLCDGAAVFNDIPDRILRRFEKPFTMTRYLPKVIWQRYVATAFGVEHPDQVEHNLLEQFIGAVKGQSYHWAQEEGIDYTLAIPAVRHDNLAGRPAFANSLLGPSWNYEAPVYRFANNDVIDTDLIAELRLLGERHTIEIPWRDGDVAVVDNKRVMHGRREITVPLSQRQLFIAMGLDVLLAKSDSEV